MRLTTDQIEQLRQAVIELWDQIGVFHPTDDSEDHLTDWPRDEYDHYLPAIATYLDRRDLDGLATYLARVRTVDMGMASRLEQDRSAAQALTEWYKRVLRIEDE